MKMIKITDFCGSDIDGVLKIANDSFSVSWSKQGFTDTANNPDALFSVAKSDGAVVGYLCAYFMSDEGEIADIATDVNFRRLGVGSLLMERAIDTALERGTRTMFLEVRKSNSAAIALYKKFGFSEVGERRAYYTHPTEDALIMKLNLQKGPFYADTRA